MWGCHPSAKPPTGEVWVDFASPPTKTGGSGAQRFPAKTEIEKTFRKTSKTILKKIRKKSISPLIVLGF